METRRLTMRRRCNERRSAPGRFALSSLIAVLALSACGTAGVRIERPTLTAVPVTTVTAVPSPIVGAQATQTRQAELSQLATATVPTATVGVSVPAPTAPTTPAATSTLAAPFLPPAAPSVAPTRPPAPTAAASAAPSAQGIGQAVVGSPTPLPDVGVAPAGWKVYQTPPRQPPFAIAYPPDWTVEEDFNNASGAQVYFRAPNDPQRIFLAIQVDKFTLTSADQADMARDALFRFNSGCEATNRGLDVTRENRFAGTVVRSVGMTCDARGGLLYLYLGVGGIGTDPKLSYNPWYFRCRAPYDDYPRYADSVFLPMLNSLAISLPTKQR